MNDGYEFRLTIHNLTTGRLRSYSIPVWAVVAVLIGTWVLALSVGCASAPPAAPQRLRPERADGGVDTDAGHLPPPVRDALRLGPPPSDPDARCLWECRRYGAVTSDAPAGSVYTCEALCAPRDGGGR